MKHLWKDLLLLWSILFLLPPQPNKNAPLSFSIHSIKISINTSISHDHNHSSLLLHHAPSTPPNPWSLTPSLATIATMNDYVSICLPISHPHLNLPPTNHRQPFPMHHGLSMALAYATYNLGHITCPLLAVSICIVLCNGCWYRFAMCRRHIMGYKNLKILS